MNWQPSGRQPALFVPPPAAANLDEAHRAIDQWEHYSHRKLDLEQRLAVELMMAENSSGCWAARTTGRAESRQNGKGDEIEVVEAWGLTQRAEAIVHTAHEIPTSKSAHLRLAAHLNSHRDLRRLVKHVHASNSDRSVVMNKGGICVYRTRTAGGGRGLDDISRLVVDEAQHAQPEQLASSTPILAANPNPQTNFAGTGGIAGKSDWWWEMRLRALRPDPGDFSWLEHSAEIIRLNADGAVETVSPDPNDLKSWRKANPAHPERISAEFLAEQLRLLGPDLFSREHLCVWDPVPVVGGKGEITDVQWSRLVDGSARVSAWVLGVDVAPEGASASIGNVGARADGVGYAEVFDSKPGTSWVADRLGVAIDRLKPGAVGVDASGPVQMILPDIRKVCQVARVKLVEVTSRAYAAACADFVQAVKDRRLVHGGQDWLNDAVAGGRRRDYGDSWMWDRRVSADITPLVAVTVARRAAFEAPKESVPLVAWR